MNQSATIPQTGREGLANARILSRIQIGITIALSAAWIIFQVRFFLHAGALWRDEIVSVNVSDSAHIADIWRNLQYDSFPVLWPILLRAWIHCGLGTTDLHLRLLGLLVGLGILVAVFVNARKFRIRTPIIALTLLGFNAALICDGGAIRGYGMGVLMELLTFGLLWDVATRPTPLRIIVALLIALAGVHILFYNCVILAAVCCGALAVTLLDRQWRRAAIIAGIGFVCAVSMSVYVPIIARRNSFRAMLVTEPTLKLLCGKFAEAVSYDTSTHATSSAFNLIAWEVAILLALYLGLRTLLSARPNPRAPSLQKLVVFNLVALSAAIVGYYLFLRKLSYFTQPWYYLALLALLATCADALINSIAGNRLKMFVAVGSLAFCTVAFLPTWTDAGLRKTGIDLDAQNLASMSKPGDLILISPWYFGVSFERYYHGSADYLTVPDVQNLGFQKYDLLIPYMNDRHAMDQTLARAAEALKSGHNVFLLGYFPFPSNDLIYPTLPPPNPNDPSTWNDAIYYDLWERQILFFLTHHTTQTVRVPTRWDGVSNFERVWLFAMRGWVDSSNEANQLK